jgi:nicotinate-nucleotide adenylyltransferase
MQAPRIGAYGGTFDPIHCGHVQVASAVLDGFGLDEVIIIPAANPPHKDPRTLSSSHHRFAMAALATLGIPGVRVSVVEIDSPANPYTFETVARLRTRYGPQAELFFIIGSDSFEEMHTWRRPDLILSNCNLIVAARPGYEMSNPGLGRLLDTALESGPRGGGCPTIIDLTGEKSRRPEPQEARQTGLIFLTDYIRVDAAATEVRLRVSRNLPIDGMVPEGVADYIRKYELYQTGEPAEIQ